MGFLSDAFKSGISALFGGTAAGSLLGVNALDEPIKDLPTPVPAPPAPTPVDPEVVRAKEAIRRRAAAGGGTRANIKTSPSGLESSASARKKTLLGA